MRPEQGTTHRALRTKMEEKCTPLVAITRTALKPVAAEDPAISQYPRGVFMALHTQLVAKQNSATVTNRTFLTRLPPESQQRILSQSTRVTLEKEERLLEAGAALTWSYLPCTGLVSLQTMTEEGETVEVAMIGNEGVVGLPVGATSLANPHTAIVILPGEALRVRADILDKEFGRDPALQRAL